MTCSRVRPGVGGGVDLSRRNKGGCMSKIFREFFGHRIRKQGEGVDGGDKWQGLTRQCARQSSRRMGNRKQKG